MHTMVIHLTFTLVDEHRIPAGRACHLTEEPGAITVNIARTNPPHATPALCVELNRVLARVLEAGEWVQRWDAADTDRTLKPAQGLGIGSSTWRIVSAEALPDGILCMPVEGPGRIDLVLREHEISQQLVDEMNTYIARLVGDGLVIQQWDDSRPPA